ncbi:efflux MFS transporter permease [Alicyclobacillus dauci]|uniref:MFS transporter n=1 Tax=Alicyclobacillus dauci TaxID=1475485 RepID=A0ABY6Z431_9BACL|nr:MFS transporter [Alicyclobacillus dauci]WAH37592.1 MFS transporter [Alicyclobacillus dauci]
MNQPNGSPAADTHIGKFPRYLVISLLTMFAFGPQYVLNVSFMLNQIIIQNGFAVGTNTLLLPSVISNLAFALCVPFGPVFSRVFGLRRSYLTLVAVFFCGALLSACSPHMVLFTIGRLIQGLSAGSLFLTILPVSLMSFPNAVRNRFLLLAIGGLFGSSAVGAFLGSLSLTADAWRWLFLLGALGPVFCFLVGYIALPKGEAQPHHIPFDIWGAVILIAIVVVALFPSIHLESLGIGSVYVWPFFLIALLLFALFLIVEYHLEHPLVHFRAIRSAKQIFGTSMAIISHIALIVTLIGVNGFLRNVKNTKFLSIVHLYLWFIIGVVIVALLGTWLYDKLGAGVLGIIGSLAVVLVSLYWRAMGTQTSLGQLDIEMGCVGGSIGLVLISGALGTALAGDIHEARWRSVSLHFTRNLIGAIVAPVAAWMVYKETAIHYEDMRAQISLANPEVNLEMAKLTQDLLNHGVPAGTAKVAAFAALMQNAQQAALQSAFHNLFTVLLVLGMLMTLTSIGMAVTGKGRSLVQKAAQTATAAQKPEPPRMLIEAGATASPSSQHGSAQR